MGFATSQQLTRYYELYQTIDVTFTKEVIKTTGLIPQQVFIKAMGDQWPCVIHSTSFLGAKIIAGNKSGLYAKIQQGTTSVSLRFSFFMSDKNVPISFFISAKVMGLNQYGGSPDLVLISLSYTQRAPDDLIEILGSLLEANINSTKRREERITLNPDTMRKLGIFQKETVIFVQGVPRRCIIRDLSFGGAKIIMVGIGQFLKDKDIVLRIDLEDPRIALGIKGKILRTEEIENRKDLVALAILFTESEVPMAYKLRINSYISQIKKASDEDENSSPDTAKTSAQTAAASPSQTASPDSTNTEKPANVSGTADPADTSVSP